jgi:hypothetical protein
MKPDFTLIVPKPCDENWKEFTPTERGGFCAACRKEVIDFTNWSDEEIKQHFARVSGSTCGKFRSNQLKSYSEPKSKPASAWRLAALLALLSLWFGKPSMAQTSKGKAVYTVVDEKRTIPSVADTLIAKISIYGQVKDEQGITMPGVNIVRKGSNQTTVSDADGKFLLEIVRPRYNETLEVSFIGMVSTEVQVQALTSRKEIEIVLQPDITALGETIVVGGVTSVGRWSPRRLWWKVRGIFTR